MEWFDEAERRTRHDMGTRKQRYENGRNIRWDRRHCYRCGYRLRGLIGDPCRCPECGLLNPSRIPGQVHSAVRAVLRPLRSSSRLTAAGPLGLGLALALLCREHYLAAALPAVIGLALWSLGLLRFRRLRATCPGASAVLLAYHASGAAFAMMFIVVALGLLGTGLGFMIEAIPWVAGPAAWAWAEMRLWKLVRAQAIQAHYAILDGSTTLSGADQC
jgi:hypothetical protein